MKKKTNAVCCKNFERIAIQYLDLSISDDEILNMLAELLLRVEDDLPLASRDLQSISHEIGQYLNRKIVREHCIFNRPLQSCTLDEIDLKTEIARTMRKLEK